MWKKKNIDFVLHETDNVRLIFRFYPRRSSCHSFDDKLPKSWEEVYKVYYAYAIIEQYRGSAEEQWKSSIIFEQHCDECSRIDAIGNICLMLADGKEIWTDEDGEELSVLNCPFQPFGTGTEWMITKWVSIEYGYDEEDEDVVYTYYIFMMFKYNGVGYKFTLEKEKVKAFGEYLLNCCEYMLEHGEPI